MTGADVNARSRSTRLLLRALGTVERVGNRLPDPFWLFWLLAGVVVVLSAVLATAGVSAVRPDTGKEIVARSLLSKEGLGTIFGDAVQNFASFPPLATILTVMLGIAVAERSGLFAAVLHRMVTRVPARYLTFALALTAMVGHVAGDAAYVTLIPLGALIFRAAGRSPVLGCIVAFVSVSAGYDASPVLTTTDTLLSSITTAAAATITPGYVVTPVANYYFGLGSSVLVAVMITVVVETVLARRPDLAGDENGDGSAELPEELTATQRRALRRTGLVALAALAVPVLALVPDSSPLRGEGGSVVGSPLFGGMAVVLGLFFALIGAVYGRLTGTLPAARDVVEAMVGGLRSMAPILVLFFAISQFLAYFKWTRLGEILAIVGANALRALELHGWVVLVGVALLITVMNLFVTSGSALWSLAAPVFVPMLMLVGIEPEATQAVYRVADSVTNCITPMSPYFAMALGFVQRYRASAGIGTLISATLPVAVVVWITWVAFAVLWYQLGIPFGPGA